jgi:hypothetical protein
MQADIAGLLAVYADLDTFLDAIAGSLKPSTIDHGATTSHRAIG